MEFITRSEREKQHYRIEEYIGWLDRFTCELETLKHKYYSMTKSLAYLDEKWDILYSEYSKKLPSDDDVVYIGKHLNPVLSSGTSKIISDIKSNIPYILLNISEIEDCIEETTQILRLAKTRVGKFICSNKTIIDVEPTIRKIHRDINEAINDSAKYQHQMYWVTICIRRL